MDKIEVTQADRDEAANLIGRIGLSWSGDMIREGRSDDHDYVQAFARHRVRALTQAGASLTAAQTAGPVLLEALKAARQIITDIDDYMKEPDRGDWGVECALCMGELLDDDRQAIANIHEAIAQAQEPE